MRLVFLLSAIAVCSIVKSQPQVSLLLNVPEETRPLKIGEKVPDIFFKEINNYKVKSASLSELYENKLLILDFWSTWCAVCIAQFPKIEELQKKLGDKVLILPVGFDAIKSGSIKEFIEKRKGTPREMKIPTTIQQIDDTLLLQIFPCQSMPHEVWIGKDGTVLGFTDHTALTLENINNILEKKIETISNKRTLKMLEPGETFLIKRNTDKKLPEYSSAIGPYIDSLMNFGMYKRGYDSAVLRWVGINNTVLDYYSVGYKDSIGEYIGSVKKRFIIEGKKESFYKDWRDDLTLDNWEHEKFARENLFCYELVLPKSQSLSYAAQKMISDFNRFFKITSKVEKRKVTCYAIVQKGGDDKIKFTEGAKEEFLEDNYGSIHMAGFPMKFLVMQLSNRVATNRIFIDDTGYKNRIDIKIPSTAHDLGSFKEALNKYNLDIIEVERMLPMVILTKQ